MDTSRQPVTIEISIYQKNELQILRADGHLVYQTITQAKDQLSDLEAQVDGYIFDMSRVLKVDSTGFGLILHLIKRIPKESRLVIVLTDPFIRELFQITKVNQLVDIYDSLQDAAASFQKTGF